MIPVEYCLFRIERECVPEWGKATTEFIEYVFAPTKEAAQEFIHHKHGKTSYYSLDRCETVDTIDRLSFTVYHTQMQQEY